MNEDFFLNLKISHTDQNFPKIIHQIWINEDNRKMPEKWKKSPIEWIRHHNDYIYILWDKNMSLKFVKNFFPQYLDFYKNVKYTIQRCDLIRYMFLYKFGGIYSDLDNYPLKNIEKFLNKKFDVYFVESNASVKTINNNLIVTKEKNKIFLEILNKIYTNYKFYPKISKTLNVVSTNGINYINKIIKQNRYKTHIFPYEIFNPSSMFYENYKIDENQVIAATKGGSWYSNDIRLFIYLKKNFTTLILILTLIIIIIIITTILILKKNNNNKNVTG